MPLKLSAVSKRVVAQGAGEVLLVLLMAVLDVLLQRCQTLVAPVAVGAGQQLGEGIWRSRWQVCTGDSGGVGEGWGKAEEGEGKAGQKVSESMAANGRAAQEWYGSYLCNLLHMRATVSGWHPLHYDLLPTPHTHTHTLVLLHTHTQKIITHRHTHNNSPYLPNCSKHFLMPFPLTRSSRLQRES